MSKMISRFNSHFYRHDDGRYMPSVTTIISKTLANQGLNLWYKQLGLQADIVARESADKGSRVHHAIDMAVGHNAIVILQPDYAPNFTSEEIFRLAKNNYVEIMQHEDEYEMVIRALQFLEQFPYSEITSEQHLFSELNYAGTIDIQIVLDEDFQLVVNNTKVNLPKGKIIILDWKTGNAYPEQLLQLSAYAKMVGEPVENALIVYLNAKTKSKISIKNLDLETINNSFDNFLAVKNVYERLFAIKPPVSIELPTFILFNRLC